MRTIVQVQPSWARLVHPGGLRCQLRTIVHAVFRQQVCQECLAIGCIKRTIAWNPTGCVAPVIFTPNNCMVLLSCGQGPDPDPEQLFVQAAQSLPGQPESEQLFGLGSGEPGWADPEERTMAVFCGFGVVARSPINQAKPRSRSLGNPEPDCLKHPRKCFLLICGFYATMLYRLWVFMGLCGCFHAFLCKCSKFL